MSSPSPEEVQAIFDDPLFPRLPPVCGAEHPEREGVHCMRPVDQCFVYHLSEEPGPYGGTLDVHWSNPKEKPKPEKESNPSKAKGIADRVRGGKVPADSLPHSPSHKLYEAEGPLTSKIAAERTEVTRQGQLRQTAEFLDAHVGEWIPGTAFNTPEVGGQDGTRRVRELRDDYNWPIENRPMKDSTTWEYRLAPLAELADAPDGTVSAD